MLYLYISKTKEKEIYNMRKMRTYKIVATTNGYIARRDIMFNGRTEVTLESGLTLKEARKILLEMFNGYFDWEYGYSPNWGIAVIKSAKRIEGATATYKDGTRSFGWDSRTFSIEEETE